MDERTKAIVSSIVIIAVSVAGLFGQNLDASELTKVLMAVASLMGTCYGLWKNMNFTEEAATAQRLLDELKGKGV